MIPLDLFKESKHNKPIESRRDAWLSFLSDDSPERIMEIIEKYPAFKDMYGELYEICCNIEEVMSMFSKELRELDRNTVQYMIEEQQERLDEMKRERAALQAEIDEQRKVCERQKREYEEQKRECEEQKRVHEEQKKAYEEQQKEIDRMKLIIERLMKNQEHRE